MKNFLSVLVLLTVTAAIAAGCGGQQTATETAPGNGIDKIKNQIYAGQLLFQSRCTNCHKIDGVGGKKGPDLSNIGAKRDGAYLDKWLSDPKSVKPAAKMPKPRLTDEERADLVEYLAEQKN